MFLKLGIHYVLNKPHIVMKSYYLYPYGIIQNCQPRLCIFPIGTEKVFILISDVLHIDGRFFTIEKIKKVYSLDNINRSE